MLAGRSRDRSRSPSAPSRAPGPSATAGIESRALNILGRRPRRPRRHRRPASSCCGSPWRSPIRSTTRSSVPRAYANLGTMLEMGGFVEEALEVSLAGAESTERYGSELSFRDLPRGQRGADAHRAGPLPGGGGPARAPDCPSVLPGVSTIHLHGTLGPPAAADRRPRRRPAGTSSIARERGEQHRRRPVRHRPPHVRDGDRAVGRRSGGRARDRARRVRSAGRDGRRDHPRPAGDAGGARRADLAVRARAARDAAAAEARRRRRRGRDRALPRRRPERLPSPDELATQEIGWRMAICAAELPARPARTIRRLGRHPAGAWPHDPRRSSRRTSLWRAAEASADRGEPGAAAEPSARGPRHRGAASERRLLVGADRRPRPAPARRSVAGGGRRRDRGAPTHASRRSRRDPFGLTTREREVLPSSPRATRTSGSPRRCSSARARPASTSRTSWASSASRRGPRRRRSRSGSGSTGRRPRRSAIGRPTVGPHRLGAPRHSRSRLRSAALTRSSSVDSTPTSASAARDASRASASE